MVLGSLASKFFLDTGGLWALLSLVPLIILYLIRPKPKERTIPSLMFFLRDLRSRDTRSFFRRFTKDWLFLLQLLTLLLLAFAVAKPFIMVPERALAESSIIVIDASASMQTKMDGKTRFEEAKDIAMDNLAARNTIIVARNTPLIAMIDEPSGDAKDFIKALEPSATSTAIYDAVRSAIDYAGEGIRVVVISDFIETEVEGDVNTVKRALMAKGAAVDYIPVSNEANNIGIVDLVVGDEKTSVQVRNYYPEERQVTVKVGNIKETLTLKPGGADVFTFSTPTGVNTVELDVNDHFPLDDKAFISTPEDTELKVLFITNDNRVEQSNMWIAFKAINEKTNYQLIMEKAVPPKSIKIEHDIVVLKDFDQSKILPGVFRDLAKEAREKGASGIITAQRGMFNFAPLEDVLPVTYVSENKEGSDIIKTEPEIESLTKDVNFGSVDYYYNTKPKPGTRTIAFARDDNGTMVAVEQIGQGKLLYYGIFDQDINVDGQLRRSTFKHDLFYPIFWKRVLDLLTDTPSVENLNQRAGRVITLANGEKIQTPQGDVVEGIFMLEKQGIYNFRNQKIAVNLLNSKESDVSGKFTEKEYREVETEEVVRESPKPLTSIFIIAGLIVLMLELLYIKVRGDM